TMIQGGNAINVIPDHSVIKADARAFTPEEFDRVETSLQKLASDTIVPEVQVKASMTRNFPPWPWAASTDALLARAQKLYAEIGGKLAGVRVGSSADVAFAAETRTPSIDGVAILGGGAHGVDDHADLSSIVPRVYLLTRMLMDLGHNPPVKPAERRSEEHTSELQSPDHLVCRLLLEKKKKIERQRGKCHTATDVVP